MKTISNGITFMKNGKFIKLYETIYDRFKQGHGLLEGDVVKLKDGYKTSEHYKALPTSIQVRLEDSEKSGYNLRVGRLHTPNAQYGSMGYVALPATHADLYQERAPGAFGNLVTVPIGLLEPIDTGVNLPPVSKKNKRSGKEAPYQKPSKKSKNKDAVTDEQTDVGEKQNYAKKGDYELATKNKKPSVGANSYDDSKPSTNYKPLAKNGKKPKTLKESMENIENIYMSILNEDVELEPDAEVNENPGLNRGPRAVINGKEVDLKSLKLDGVDMSDFPDFVDAYIVSGTFKDGTMMSDDEIDELNVNYPEITQELAHDSLHEADEPADAPASGTEELNEWESDDTDPESRPKRPDTHHAKGDVPRLVSNTLHAKSGKIVPKDTPLSDWEELNEGDIEESMVKPECWNKETNAVIDECWNEDGSMKQDCWNEDTGDTTGTTSEVTQNPEEMEQTGPL